MTIVDGGDIVFSEVIDSILRSAFYECTSQYSLSFRFIVRSAVGRKGVLAKRCPFLLREGLTLEQCEQ